MQAHPTQARARTTGTSPTAVRGALRAVEALLLRGGQQTARRNAWTAVLEDRKRARDRSEAQHVLETLGAAPVLPVTAASAALEVVRSPGGGEA